MRRRDDLIGSILRSVLATLFFIVSPLASAIRNIGLIKSSRRRIRVRSLFQ